MMNVEDVAEGRWCNKRNEVAEVWWSQGCKMSCMITAILSEILNLTGISEDVLAPKRFRLSTEAKQPSSGPDRS